jgi:hypothetical protein
MYEPGQLVWFKEQRQEIQGVAITKLHRRWRGPFIVLMTFPSNVRIRPLGGSSPTSLVHIDAVKHFKLRNGKIPVLLDFTRVLTPEEETPEADATPTPTKKDYRVTAVTDFVYERGAMQFALMYAGYSDKYWTPESDMECPALVQEFFCREGTAAASMSKWQATECPPTADDAVIGAVSISPGGYGTATPVEPSNEQPLPAVNLLHPQSNSTPTAEAANRE